MGQPTAESIEQRILEDLQSTLLGISTEDATTDYWYTVLYVEIHEGDMPKVSGFPAIIIGTDVNATRDDIESRTNTVNLETLEFTLTGHMQAATRPDRALRRFKRDIVTALMLDPTRGGLATHTHIQRSVYQNVPTVTQPLLSLQVEGRVEYRTQVASQETAV